MAKTIEDGDLNMKTVKRVTLEPELEELAAEWKPEMRLIVAKKFRRWARQLSVSARILMKQERVGRNAKVSLPRVPWRKLPLN